MEVGDENNSTMVAPSRNELSANDVKKKCWDQRKALQGEPSCIICGRYGEYICDETDDDICSLECKRILLSRLVKLQKPVTHAPPTRLPATDDCFYVRETNNNKPEFRDVNPNQTELLRKKLEICVSGNCVPDPALSFASCNLPQKLLDNIEKSAGYEIPTPVQMQAIPAALFGKSLLVSAETGSGKTASYLIPIISHCANLNHEKLQIKPLAIVLTPTRELCIQVEEQAKLLGKGLPFKTALVVGGDPMPGQIYRIQQQVEMIVGTPGRLIDLLTKYDVALDSVSILVLDEVDCMLQRGFRDQVMQIFRALSQPQVLMYSATIPKEVDKMANLMEKDIISVSVGRPNRPNGTVKQLPIWVESKKKKKKLFEILTSKQHFRPPAVVFVGSRLGADLLSEAIRVTTGVKALSIHGKKPMKERREIIRSFLVGEVPVVVATGVLGRGVVLLGVRQVIVFDMPNSIDEYIHQIGRASRIGEEGRAIVFVNDEDNKCFTELVDFLKSSGSPIPRELLNYRYTRGTSSVAKNQKKRKLWG